MLMSDKHQHGKTTVQRGLTLYYWPTPNGRKVTIMLEELGVAYGLAYINIRRDEQFGPDFLRIAPNGKVPALVDTDANGEDSVSIFESGAILQYLGRKFGRFYGQSERDKSAVEQWLFWQMAGLGPMAGQANHFRNIAAEKLPYAMERYRGETVRLYQVMEKQLNQEPYLAGAYSIADMACYPWVVQHGNAGIALEDFPNISKWVERISTRDAVERAMLVGKDERKRQKRTASLTTNQKGTDQILMQAAEPDCE